MKLVLTLLFLGTMLGLAGCADSTQEPETTLTALQICHALHQKLLSTSEMSQGHNNERVSATCTGGVTVQYPRKIYLPNNYKFTGV